MTLRKIDDLVELEEDEELGNSFVTRDPKVQKLLWKAVMEVDDKVHLPTTPLFKRLWAPTESPGFNSRHSREVRDTRGLSYPFIFASNVTSAIVLGDSSTSEDGNDEDDDEDLLISSSEDYSYPSQN